MKILLVDKNKRVGSFIKRELEKDCHSIILANNAKMMNLKLKEFERFDLIILDPDLPDMESKELILFMSIRFPDTPVFLHSYPGDFEEMQELPNVLAYIEKKGNSINRIKEILAEIAWDSVPGTNSWKQQTNN